MSTFPFPKGSLIPPVWLLSHDSVGWGGGWMGKWRKGEVEPEKCSVDRGVWGRLWEEKQKVAQGGLRGGTCGWP